METGLDIKTYLIKQRHISPSILTELEIQNMIAYDGGELLIIMKNLEEEQIGVQIRYIEPIEINGAKVKSRTNKGDKVGYYYTSLNFAKPIIIVEGEIDFLSLAHVENVIGLQWVGNLSKLVIGLQEKWAKEIYLLIDNDDAGDKSIDILIEKSASLDGVFDCRGYLGDTNDINDYIVAGNVFNREIMLSFAKVLKDSPKAQEMLWEQFIIRRWRNVTINHNTFAKYIVEKHNIASIEWALFYYPSNDIWKPLHKNIAQKIILKEMEDILLEHIEVIKNQDRNNIFDFLVTHAENSEMKKMLDQRHVQEINLNDWILDLSTWDIRPYSKEDYKIHKLEYTSNLLKEWEIPEKWLIFLNQILEWRSQREEIIDFLQEFIGWLFIPSTQYEKSILLYGNGANGKGVFLEVIRDLLGVNNCIGIGMHEINRDQNLLLLLGKLANIDSDMQQGVQLDSGIIKKIISWEHIVWKVVYEKPISFAPYTRLLLATNELPYLKSADYSIKRRFVFIHLKKSFIWQEDPTLKDKLKAEKNQIFVWAIEWLKRLLVRWCFHIPDELQKDIDWFIKENDSVTQFLESWDIYIGEELTISNKDLYLTYSWFCRDNWFKPLWPIKLGNRLVDRWYARHTNGRERSIKWLWKTEW